MSSPLVAEDTDERVPAAYDRPRRGSAQTTDTFSEWAESASWARQSTSSLNPSPLPAEFNPNRRGSAVSTSSVSFNYNHPHNPYAQTQSTSHPHPTHNRNSLSSLASSSGSPLATASTFSAGHTTIGDLSTADMPLLHGGHHHSAQSDTSSVHSYPPWPRNRANSSLEDHSSVDNWSSSPVDRIRHKGSTDFARDHWTAYVSRPVPTLVIKGSPPPTASCNPLAPLRKRFARAIGAGRKVSVELQLVVELVDALEHCIVAFSGQGDDPLGVGSSTSRPSPNPSTTSNSNGRPASACSTESMSALVGLSASTAAARAADLELMNEVRSLVKELVEICPDAQRCLTDGGYGPLAFAPPPSSSSRTNLRSTGTGSRRPPSVSSMSLRAARGGNPQRLDMKDPGTADWWPRRLARDCRALLDEVGVALGGASTPTLMLAPFGGAEVGEEDQQALPLSALLGSADPNEGKREISARQEELLDEGKRRWEAYRQRESVGGEPIEA